MYGSQYTQPGCQMFHRKYGKCLSNLWQIFGQKFLKMAILLAIWIFHYKMPIFWQYGFFIAYFFHTFKFFKFDN